MWRRSLFAIIDAVERWLFHLPFKTVFCVFYVKSDFVHAIADKVAGSPVLVGFGLLADVEQQVDSLFVRLEVNTTLSVGFVAYAKDVEQEVLEQRFQFVDIGLRQCCVSVVSWLIIRQASNSVAITVGVLRSSFIAS